MIEYTQLDSIGLNSFLKNVSLFTTKGWTPIWATFKEMDDNKYFIILEKQSQ